MAFKLAPFLLLLLLLLTEFHLSASTPLDTEAYIDPYEEWDFIDTTAVNEPLMFQDPLNEPNVLVKPDVETEQKIMWGSEENSMYTQDQVQAWLATNELRVQTEYGEISGRIDSSHSRVRQFLGFVSGLIEYRFIESIMTNHKVYLTLHLLLVPSVGRLQKTRRHGKERQDWPLEVVLLVLNFCSL